MGTRQSRAEERRVAPDAFAPAHPLADSGLESLLDQRYTIMQLLRNAKISGKVLALLGMLGALCLGLALYSNSVLKSTDAAYADLANNRLAGTIKLVRFHRLTSDITAAGFRSLAYRGDTPEARANIKLETDTYTQAKKVIGEVGVLRPDLKEALAEMEDDLDIIHEAVGRALAASGRNDAETAAAIMVANKPILEELAGDLIGINGKAVVEAEQTARTLGDEVSSTARISLIIAFFGTFGALLAGYTVARIGITLPIARLQETMRTLAGGNNKIEVEGAERRDEIGDMAKAVLVFRDAAVA